MLLVIISMFTTASLGIYFLFRTKKDDFFSPLTLSFVIIFLTNIPYLISLSFNYNLLHSQVQVIISENELPVAVFRYLLLLFFGMIFLSLGIKSKWPKSITSHLPELLSNENNKKYYISTIFFFGIGLFSYYIFFQKAGGFLNWISNLNLRASFTSGSGYLMSIMSLVEVGVYTFICTFKYKNHLIKRVILLLMVILVSFLLSTLGGRKSTLFFLIFCLIVWNFSVNKIKNLPIKATLLLPIFVVYILIVPILRTPDGISNYINRPESLLEEVSDNLGQVTKQISYVDHQLLIMEKFNYNDLWWGESYLDLLYAPIPSTIYQDKPPVDDGAYVRTIAEGYEVEPNTPYNKLYQSSWPPETFGATYMNFSWVGVLIGMYLLGVFYNISYTYMKKTNYSLLTILIYGEILINFQISNLRIVQSLSQIIIWALFFTLFFSGKRVKKNNCHTKKDKLRGNI